MALSAIRSRNNWISDWNWTAWRIGHLHDDVILLLWPESLRVLLSYENWEPLSLSVGRVGENPGNEVALGLPNLNMKEKTKRILVAVAKWRHHANGLFSARILKTYCSMNVIYFLRSIFKNKRSVSIFKPYLCAHPKQGIFEPVLSTIAFMIS